jgi:acyl transferase domain-containing protein
LKSGKLKIVLENTPWPTQLRRASVNSFGYGGANAHTVLESVHSLAPGHGGVKANEKRETPRLLESSFSDRAEVFQRRLFLLPFSAHNEQALKKNIDALTNEAEKWDLLDIAFTLGCRRSNLPVRAFAVAEEGHVSDALGANDILTYKTRGSQQLSLGFVFTGTFTYDLLRSNC